MGRLALLLGGLGKAAAMIFLVIILNFMLIRLAPGDPASVMAGEAGVGDALFVQQLREQFGLDQPLTHQLWLYVKNIATLDFGYSYRAHRPVFDLIAEKLPATLLLTGSAFLVAILAGIGMGMLAGRRPNGMLDRVISVWALGLHATPLFWLGLMGIVLFSVTLRILPAFGMETIGGEGSGGFADVLHHLILPALTLGLVQSAVYARLTRAAIIDVADMEFVRTARAKGLRPWRVMVMHVFRNAMLPVITYAGIQAGQLVGGAVLTETVFAWPGIGRMTFEALLQRDYNLLLAILFVSCSMVILFNALTDFAYRLADPRVGATQ